MEKKKTKASARTKKQEGNFHKVLTGLRRDYGVSSTDLCAGLYTSSMMSHIEEGGRTPNKMNRDMLLDRLGVTNDRFEEYLGLEEYRLMKTRAQIVTCVRTREIRKAREHLAVFQSFLDDEQKAARQFYLVMNGRIAFLSGEDDPETILKIYQQAVSCTMPSYLLDDAWFHKRMLLSIQEINVLIEYLHATERQTNADHTAIKRKYLTIIEGIEKSLLDGISIAKIYPKAVYYLLRFLNENSAFRSDIREVIAYCDRAFTYLIKREKCYYFVNLLDLLVDRLEEEISSGMLSASEITTYQTILDERKQHRQALLSIYEKYHISPYTEDECYLYDENNSVFAGDAIRARRKMLGMSPDELCEDICDVRTLRRLENKETGTNAKTIRRLLTKLKLSSEYRRMTLIADRRDVIDLAEKQNRAVVHKEWKQSRQIIAEMEKIIDMRIVENIQYIKSQKTLYQLGLMEIDETSFVQQMQDALETTIPLKSIMESEDIFLSQREILCIFNMAQEMEPKETKPYRDLLWRVCRVYEEKGQVDTFFFIYELIMSWLASGLGNDGSFDVSNQISHTIIEMDLQKWRMSETYKNLYNIYWNEWEVAKKQSAPIAPERRLAQLQECQSLSRLYKNKEQTRFYQNKIDEITR